MKSLIIPMCALLLCLLLIGPSLAADWQYPVIKGAGEVVAIPEAAVQPDKAMEYKIVFDITAWPNMKDKVVPGLFKVARLINVFATGGVTPDKMDLVLVMHGPSTESVLTPEAFKKKHGYADPNQDLLAQLKKAGVKLYVCGQALKEHEIDAADVNPDITVALSALTVLPTYQLKGYAFMPF